jgi:hypothetical protein
MVNKSFSTAAVAPWSRRLSDLVNGAYGLTPDETRLMGATAPPRMPLALEADALEQGEDEAAE